MARAHLALLALLAAGCDGVSPRSGTRAYFRATPSAASDPAPQFVPGELSMTATAVMPEVHTINSLNNRIYPGVQNKSLGGTVGPGSWAVRVGLVGDVGHWVLPVADPDDATPGDFTFRLRGSFSTELLAGQHLLVFRAADRDGNLGPPRTQTLTLDPAPEMAPLYITLEWDSQADLDLRVLAPAANGGAPVEIGPRKHSNLNMPPPSEPPLTMEQVDAGGTYAFDSNGQCVIDGQRIESVTWGAAPTSGHYEVRVDTFSLCGEATARWKVTVSRDGQVRDQRFGQSTDADTRFDHGKGAGLQVTYFDL